jgi:hypothetical protein
MREYGSGEPIPGGIKLKSLENNLLKCHSVHHQFNIDHPEIDLAQVLTN